MQNLAFVGLGAMGAPMAQCLVSAGFALGVFDVREENARPLVDLGPGGGGPPGAAGARGGRGEAARPRVDRGAGGAATPGEAAENAEALFLMVVNAEQTEAALFGEHGAPERLHPAAAGRGVCAAA